MTEITKEQWAAITDELKGSMPLVEFEYKGRKLSVHRLRHNENESLLNVYVDGYIRGAWMSPDFEGFDPIAAEVWFEKKSALYKPKEKASLIKKFGKRRAAECFPGRDKKVITYTSTFGSSRTLVGQYKKLKGLKLITLGYGSRTVMSSREEIKVYD